MMYVGNDTTNKSNQVGVREYIGKQFQKYFVPGKNTAIHQPLGSRTK
jgi:hypothetical protein